MAETAIEIREKVRWDICRDSSNPPLPMERTDRARARAFLRQGPEARRWMHGGNGTRGRDRYRHSVLFHFGRATSDLPLIGSTPDTR